jgi:hypothetical protein
MILLADAGVPMLAAVWPVAWLAFIPVVLIESFVALKSLGLAFRRSLAVNAAANAVSTLVGIPVTWFALVILQGVTGGGTWRTIDTPLQKIVAVCSQAAWLCPYEHDLGWMIPAAAMILCVPFFLVSVVIEYIVVRRMVTNPPRHVRRFCWLANLASYSLIVVFWGVLLAAAL